jgi:glucokinase
MSRRLAVVADLGGTHFRVALGDPDSGEVFAVERHPTQAERGPDDIIRRIADRFRALARAAAGVAAVGVPGPVRAADGVVVRAPNLPGWENVPVKARLEELTGLTVLVGNDANLAALGEHRYGAGRGTRNLVYLTVSTGIGGGVIADGRLLLGAHGFAAELGHIPVEPGGPPCGCGGRGCLEAVASGTAVERMAIQAARRKPGSPLWRAVGGDLGRLDARVVEEVARQGDPDARGIFGVVGRYLGLGLVAVIHAFDPELVVLGGGVANAFDLFEPAMRAELDWRLMPAYRTGVNITRAALGDRSGLYGALALLAGER